jgi:hypothetical protein
MPKNRKVINTDSSQEVYQQLADATATAPKKKSKKSKVKRIVVIQDSPEVVSTPAPAHASRITPVKDLRDESTASYCCGLFTRRKPAPAEQTVNPVISQNIVRKM